MAAVFLLVDVAFSTALSDTQISLVVDERKSSRLGQEDEKEEGQKEQEITSGRKGCTKNRTYAGVEVLVMPGGAKRGLRDKVLGRGRSDCGTVDYVSGSASLVAIISMERSTRFRKLSRDYLHHWSILCCSIRRHDLRGQCRRRCRCCRLCQCFRLLRSCVSVFRGDRLGLCLWHVFVVPPRPVE